MDFDGFKEKGRNWKKVIEKLENNGSKMRGRYLAC